MTAHEAAQALWLAVADMQRALGPQPASGRDGAHTALDTVVHWTAALLAELGAAK